MTRIIDKWDREDLSFYIVKEPAIELELNSTNSAWVKESIRGYIKGTYSPSLSPTEKAHFRHLVEVKDLPEPCMCYIGQSNRARQAADAVLETFTFSRDNIMPWSNLNKANYADVPDEYIDHWVNSVVGCVVGRGVDSQLNIDYEKESFQIYQKEKRTWYGRKKLVGSPEEYTILKKYQGTVACANDLSRVSQFLEMNLRGRSNFVIIAPDEICRFMLAWLKTHNPEESFVNQEYRVNDHEAIKVTISKPGEGGVQVERVTHERQERIRKEHGVVMEVLRV